MVYSSDWQNWQVSQIQLPPVFLKFYWKKKKIHVNQDKAKSLRVTHRAQESDQTELESQLCHLLAARPWEETIPNLLPLLESEDPKRTSTVRCSK